MPRPFFIALALALLVLLLLGKRKARRDAVQTGTATTPEPNSNGYAYPGSIKRTTAPRPAVTSDPGPSYQETQDVVGIAHADGNYTVIDPAARHFTGEDIGGNYGGDW